jgi:hypothetical protein
VVVEGDSAIFDVALSCGADFLDITLAASVPNILVLPPKLSFSAATWNVTQQVFVAAADDAETELDGAIDGRARLANITFNIVRTSVAPAAFVKTEILGVSVVGASKATRRPFFDSALRGHSRHCAS